MNTSVRATLTTSLVLLTLQTAFAQTPVTIPLRATVRERNVFRWAGFMLLDAARIRRRERIEARLLTHTENT